MPEILHEDNHVLVAVKPPNLPVQADASGDLDLLTVLKDFIKTRDAKPGNVFLGLVHRLDRPAGGAIVFAKTSKAAARLAEQFRSRTVDKRYLAVVRGAPPAQSGRLVDHLCKDRDGNTVHVVPAGLPGAQEARLGYETLAMAGDLALLEVDLETGRPHQVRVQLAHAGCPLWGDQRYGAAVNTPGQQLALWAWKLSFDHPTRGERIACTSPPPSAAPWTSFAAGLAAAADNA